MSRPIVVTACMFGSSESWGPQQHPHAWHFRAGGGAVHSIKSGHSHCSKKHGYSITSSARAMRLGGYVETDRFGGGEVDDKLRLGGLLATAAQPETEPHVPA